MYNEEFLRNIMKEVEENFLINGRSYYILPGYEYIRDIITLYAKQHNLLESILVLLENNHVEESFILARSMVNNYFLIGYLLNDNSERTRLKKYHNQPLISCRYQLKNMREILKNNTFKNITDQEKKQKLSEVNQKIKEIEKQYNNKGLSVGTKPLKIVTLAKNSDEMGFSLYTSIYAEASKYEHSDITSLEIYKKEITEEISNQNAFILDMNSTDEKLKKKIFETVEMIYCDTFSKIANKIFNEEEQLLKNYDKSKLMEISLMIIGKFGDSNIKKI